jgi:hypothetical protein
MQLLRIMLYSVACISIQGICLANQAFSATQLKSGVYEGLLLAVDRSKHVTGYYREVEGEGVTKSCTFFLSGQQKGVGADIVTWGAEAFPGSIKAVSQGVILRIEKGRDHPGCASVLPPLISEGMLFDRVSTADWTSLRRVVVRRAYFFKSPGSTVRAGAYVVLGDVVGVIEGRGTWLKIEYAGNDTHVIGWLLAADTTEFRPPRR